MNSRRFQLLLCILTAPRVENEGIFYTRSLALWRVYVKLLSLTVAARRSCPTVGPSGDDFEARDCAVTTLILVILVIISLILVLIDFSYRYTH